MTDEEDDIFMLEDDTELPASSEDDNHSTWKVLIVDDEEDIHTVTKMVTNNLYFMDKKLETISAYSGKQAREVIPQHDDIALIFLDVVMETDHEGLDVVRFIRETLENHMVRIILRTGQPGQAPEMDVIVEYDINDYKEKAELTSQKLRTSIFASLRGYRDILAIEQTKKNLESIIKYSHELFHTQAIREFASHVLTQLTTLLHLGNDALYYKVESKSKEADSYLHREVLVGIGKFEKFTNITHNELPEQIFKELCTAHSEQHTIYYGDHYIAYFQTNEGTEHILYAKGRPKHKFSDNDKHLIEVFCLHVATAFEVFAPKD